MTLKHLRGLLERATVGTWEFEAVSDAARVTIGKGRQKVILARLRYRRLMNPNSCANAQLIVALRNAAPALLACAEALQAGHDMVESSVAHVSHGGPTREDAENWLKQAQAALDQLRKVTP